MFLNGIKYVFVDLHFLINCSPADNDYTLYNEDDIKSQFIIMV